MSNPEAFYREAIDLNRYSNHVALQVIRAYNNLIIDAAQKLTGTAPLSRTEVARLNTLMLQIKESLATWATDQTRYLTAELQGLALLESDFISQQIRNVVKPEFAPGVRSVQISPDFAAAVVSQNPTDLGAAIMQPSVEAQIAGISPGVVSLDASKGQNYVLPNGKTLGSALRQLSADSAEKFRVAVQNALLTGERLDDVVKGLLGSLKFADDANILQTIQKGGALTTLSDSQIRALVRTATAQIVSGVDRATYEANANVIDGYIYTATLDLRTTAICKSLDGRFFEFGKGPEPPQHFGCRSRIVMVTKTEAEGDVPEGMKRAALGGMVPAGTGYGKWLSGLSKADQDKALGGKGKGDMFRRLLKKESPDQAIRRFVSQDGSELSLKELERRYGTPKKRK
tara:strand:- start:809 stop:2008 length:1200 start_codon:yes stop_codon:yes gene_type:complete